MTIRYYFDNLALETNGILCRIFVEHMITGEEKAAVDKRFLLRRDIIIILAKYLKSGYRELVRIAVHSYIRLPLR